MTIHAESCHKLRYHAATKSSEDTKYDRYMQIILFTCVVKSAERSRGREYAPPSDLIYVMCR